ncbi:D-isomer specific 2-hydroxyacid dehydrogenase NAD-binding protein (plasmid) [Haloterrigena turkmenica DSM 5511]|uniref:D-isomer specific 2-hydroxyacid dehydrogenase NAD-binding protein n=1 Tax=Haloterrigena turkmenica (strain ATCC 51198 / DSM 5511 / JCM 9101 / NCIMB 13204 / VKM B-1734 / 4k) TaxID=543526 RepID=D2S032_HALTV|nr:hydroxyacid dehydrogenase [Haloterrigena turkmenica]ADB62729.1 D-isomer specific 2-hydroxyacid dehydrogenase NAD-binding protein [Haloterrigena turkmenica DSM 5511]
MKIFVTLPDGELRDDFFPNEVRHRLESLGSVAWNPSTDDLSEDALRDRIDGVDVLVTGWGSPRVTADVLEAADDLRLIAHTGGSVGTLVSEAVYDAGIPVVSANDVMADHTAEHTLGSILAKLRAVPELEASMKAGEFGADDVDIRTLHGKDVGLVGLGTIGRKLLDHLAPFDVSASIYDPYVNAEALAEYPFATLTDLETALDSAVVSVHAARTDETIGMLDADRLAQIPDGALFVNTARAEIVEEAALVEELRSGRLSGVFDVYHQEPLPADHEFREFDNVLLTPHVGGSQIHSPLTETVIDDIERFQRDQPLEHEIPRRQWQTMTR